MGEDDFNLFHSEGVALAASTQPLGEQQKLEWLIWSLNSVQNPSPYFLFIVCWQKHLLEKELWKNDSMSVVGIAWHSFISKAPPQAVSSTQGRTENQTNQVSSCTRRQTIAILLGHETYSLTLDWNKTWAALTAGVGVSVGCVLVLCSCEYWEVWSSWILQLGNVWETWVGVSIGWAFVSCLHEFRDVWFFGCSSKLCCKSTHILNVSVSTHHCNTLYITALFYIIYISKTTSLRGALFILRQWNLVTVFIHFLLQQK